MIRPQWARNNCIALHSQAKDDKLWSLTARREVVNKVLDDWVKECDDEATVEVLLTALNYPDFKDVKLRIESLIHLCY